MRTSRKDIENRVELINYYTNHKVSASFGIGCYLTIDGIEYERLITRGINKGTYEGISNKKAWNLLSPLMEEVYRNNK